MSTGLAVVLTVALVALKVGEVIAWPWVLVVLVALVPVIVKLAIWLWVSYRMKRATRPELYSSSNAGKPS